ncbi:hypothetical protein HKCCE2091_05015 [Rhodobacterales bacterium HKCCE2091]|nr:hypothetical protein [Rhodobacterales bacterium HKCCE2091]
MTRLFCLIGFALVLALCGAARAQDSTVEPRTRSVLEAAGLYDVLTILSEETVAAADEMEAELFPGKGGASWRRELARIYAPERMIADFEANWPEGSLTGDEAAEVMDFLSGDLGRRVVAAEVDARRAISDPDTLAVAEEAWREAEAEGGRRVELLDRQAAALSLVDENVAGALNGQYEALRGLSDGGGLVTPMGEEMILAQVWSQEPALRARTESWLGAYQVLAYGGLSDAELEAYIEATETEAFRALTQAVFAALGPAVEARQYALGRAAARYVVSEEL